ncbi:unnamed protein product, partial [marine sediment metagenome]
MPDDPQPGSPGTPTGDPGSGITDPGATPAPETQPNQKILA